VVAHQSADLQLVEIDRVVLAQQRKRGLVVEVAPLPLHLLLFALEELYRLATARAALRAATHAPVGFGEQLLGLAVAARVARIVDHLPSCGDFAAAPQDDVQHPFLLRPWHQLVL
jgi:hypothetical protein